MATAQKPPRSTVTVTIKVDTDPGQSLTITALGGFKTDDANQPTIIATVVRYKNFLKTQAETQVIMTIPQE